MKDRDKVRKLWINYFLVFFFFGFGSDSLVFSDFELIFFFTLFDFAVTFFFF